MSIQHHSHQQSSNYHRQFAAQPGHRWFSPILTVALAAVFYGVAVLVQFASIFIWALFAVGDAGFDAVADRFFDFNSVSGVVFGLINVILMWPAVELATRCVYRRWFSSMISIGRGMRWGLFGRYLLLALPVWVVCGFVMVLFSDGATGNLTSGVVWNGHVLGMLIALLLLVPIQATTEEIAFRGLAMNVIGGWLRHPAWAVLIPVPFFVFGHDYDVPGLIDVGIFAVIVGTLTIITGGLEAGIAFHVVNNLFAFILGVLAGADLNATSSPTVEVIMSITAPFVFALIVVLDHRRRGGRVLRLDGPSPRRGGPGDSGPLRPRGDGPENAAAGAGSDVSADIEGSASL